MTDRVALIVDDHQLFSAGLSHIVGSLCCIDRAACFPDPQSAIEASGTWDIRLVITDYYMPGLNGADAVREFRRRFPSAPVVVISSSVSGVDRAACLKAGAAAYYEKHEDPQAVLDSLERILSAGSCGQADRGRRAANRAAQFDLTDRQIDILVQLARGHSVKEIAAQLSISSETVKTHLAKLYKKLGVSGRSAASAWARARGII